MNNNQKLVTFSDGVFAFSVTVQLILVDQLFLIVTCRVLLILTDLTGFRVSRFIFSKLLKKKKTFFNFKMSRLNTKCEPLSSIIMGVFFSAVV